MMDATRESAEADESHEERLARNWTEILQELRVIQTGSQILTGFLLTLAFQPRFATVDAFQSDLYLGLVIAAALTTVLGLTPVSLHRVLFHHNAKEVIVRVANRVLKITLGAVAVTLIGTIVLIFDVVLGRPWGFAFGGIALGAIILLWIIIPAMALRRAREAVAARGVR